MQFDSPVLLMIKNTINTNTSFCIYDYSFRKYHSLVLHFSESVNDGIWRKVISEKLFYVREGRSKDFLLQCSVWNCGIVREI